MNKDIEQFLKSIYRYIQIGVYIRGFQDKNTKKFVREIAEVVEFYVNEENEAICNTIYKKSMEGRTIRHNPSKYLIDYLEGQGVVLPKDIIHVEENEEQNETVNSTENIQTVHANYTEPVNPTVSASISEQSQVNPSSQGFMNHQVSGNNQISSDVESLF